jgi:xylulokinase
VAVGTGDDFSTPLGAGATLPGEVTVSIGTGEVVGGLTGSVLIDAEHLVESHAYPAGGYFIENPGWLSGGAVAWLKDLLGISSFADFDALAATSPPGAEGVLFLPALTGATAPEWSAGARACFYGLTPAHGARHMARALLEGTSFAMRDVVERLMKLGIRPLRLSLLSGGSRSRLSAQIRADVSGHSVVLHKYADTSVIGAAMLAGVAAGMFKTVAEAASCAPTPRETLDPTLSASAVLDDSYWRYRELFQSLKLMFNAKG